MWQNAQSWALDIILTICELLFIRRLLLISVQNQVCEKNK